MHVNCSSNLTNSILKWFINDQEVQSEHLIAYHLNNEYPVLLLTMRLEETWFERYNELRLECRALVYETVANFQKKLNVQIIDFHRRQLPSITVKGKISNKQNINNGRSFNTAGIHVHRNNNGFNQENYYRNTIGQQRNSINGAPSLTELIPGTTRSSASLTILNPADEQPPPSNTDLDYHHFNNNHHNHQLTYQRSPAPSGGNLHINNQRNGRLNQQQQQQRPTSTVKRKRKRPTNVNLFNQLDYELYPGKN